MSKPAASRPWWDELQLPPATADLLAGHPTDTPAVLAYQARSDPGGFKTLFPDAARADLARALAARLASDRPDAVGYGDLRDALDEVAGKRPLQAPPGFGVISPPGQAPGVPPLGNLAPPRPSGRGRYPPPKPSPKPGG